MFSFTKDQIEKKKVKSIIEILTSSPINTDRYKYPIIASDLQIYDIKEYQQLNSYGYISSPFTREKFKTSPYPFHYPDFQSFIKLGNIKNIAKLCTCPITQSRMSSPIIARINFKTSNSDSLQFIVVCDKEALNNLPNEMTIVSKREWSDLRELSNYFKMDIQKNITSPFKKSTAINWLYSLREIHLKFIPFNTQSSIMHHSPYNGGSVYFSSSVESAIIEAKYIANGLIQKNINAEQQSCWLFGALRCS